MQKSKRCPWAAINELETIYHDTEWGMPVHDDRRFFEFLILEGAQAGLSWDTILRKRDHYRRAFAGFDPHQVARFGKRDVARLINDAGIVRHHEGLRRHAGHMASIDDFIRSSEAINDEDRHKFCKRSADAA